MRFTLSPVETEGNRGRRVGYTLSPLKTERDWGSCGIHTAPDRNRKKWGQRVGFTLPPIRNEKKRNGGSTCCPRSERKELGTACAVPIRNKKKRHGGSKCCPVRREMKRNGGSKCCPCSKRNEKKWGRHVLPPFEKNNEKKEGGGMNALLLPSPFPLPPPSPFPCNRAPSLLPVAPPCSHLSISVPTSLEEGRGCRCDFLAVVRWRRRVSLVMTWHLGGYQRRCRGRWRW